jgi:hypothetical protein
VKTSKDSEGRQQEAPPRFIALLFLWATTQVRTMKQNQGLIQQATQFFFYFIFTFLKNN